MTNTISGTRSNAVNQGFTPGAVDNISSLPVVVSKNFWYTIVFSHAIPYFLLPVEEKQPKHYRDKEDTNDDSEDEETLDPVSENKIVANIFEPTRTNHIVNFINTVSFLADNKAIPKGSIIFCNTTTLPEPQLIFTDRLRWLQLINEPFPTNHFYILERIGKQLQISCGANITNARKKTGNHKILPTIKDGLPYFYVSINDKVLPLDIIVNGKDYQKNIGKNGNYYQGNITITKSITHYVKYFLEGFLHSDDYVFVSVPFPQIKIPPVLTLSGDELALRLPKINNFMNANYMISNSASEQLPSYQVSDSQIKNILNDLSRMVGK